MAFNGNRSADSLALPRGTYKVVLRGNQLNEEGLGVLEVMSGIQLPGSTAMILVKI